MTNRLSWAPPTQDDPLVITTRPGDAASRSIKGLDGRDAIVEGPRGHIDGPLSIHGGGHVRVIGQTITADGSARPFYPQAQTKSLFVEGCHFRGVGLQEGLNFHQAAGADVYVQNTLVDPIVGELTGQHADVLQTWAGPGRLFVDRLEGTSNYQGLFLDPFKFPEASPKVNVLGFDLRRVLIRGVGSSGFWQSGVFPVRTEGCVVVTISTKTRAQLLRRGTGNPVDPWADVVIVRPATAADVAAYPSILLGRPGAGYVSPGYNTPEGAPNMAAPVIRSITATKATVKPGEAFTVVVDAFDPDSRAVTVTTTVTDSGGSKGTASAVVQVGDPVTIALASDDPAVRVVADPLKPGTFTVTA